MERTVQAVEGQIRVILLALEARLGATVAAGGRERRKDSVRESQREGCVCSRLGW